MLHLRNLTLESSEVTSQRRVEQSARLCGIVGHVLAVSHGHSCLGQGGGGGGHRGSVAGEAAGGHEGVVVH